MAIARQRILICLSRLDSGLDCIIPVENNQLDSPAQDDKMNVREEAINRMLRILEHFIRKLSTAIHLPILLKKREFYEIFKNRCMIDVEMFLLLVAKENPEIRQYIEEFNRSKGSSEVSLKVAIVGKEYHHRISEQTHLRWPVILEFLKKYENEVRWILDNAKDEIEPLDKDTMTHVESLKHIAEWQMRLSPKQLRERRTELRNAMILISRKGAEIEKLENEIQNENMKYEEAIGKYGEEINEVNGIIKETGERYRDKLESKMKDYEVASLKLRRDSLEEKGSLFNQLRAHEAMLESMTQANLELEKSLREQCRKAEEMDSLARNSYDRDLSKLNELKETLEVQLRMTDRHLQILKNEYDVQSVLFMNLKKERELAMMQAFAEQLDNFEKNRAARIIQRTWRAYHERISTKKKKKTRRAK